MTTEPVETFVFLPFSTYKALDNKAKRTETPPAREIPSSRKEEQPVVESTEALAEEPEQSPVEKDVTKSYRSAQIKKLLLYIKKSHGSETIVALPNLEDLIQAALSNKRKALPNEEVFFTFLFENGMGRFVKNRSKIDLYYKGGLWYQV